MENKRIARLEQITTIRLDANGHEYSENIVAVRFVGMNETMRYKFTSYDAAKNYADELRRKHTTID